MFKSTQIPRPSRLFPPSFYHRQALWLLVAFVVFWLLFDYTNLDLDIARYYYDFENQTWPWVKHPTMRFLYNFSKQLIMGFGGILLGLFIYSFKNYKLAPYHRIFLFIILCLILVPLEISSMKQVFYKARPEQALDFGGSLNHTKLFEFLWGEKDATNWPGGHASGGASLLALYFPLRERSRILGYLGIGFALFYWFGMSWIQVMRGQHFMSHNLWTLWFAWLTILLIHRYLFKSRL